MKQVIATVTLSFQNGYDTSRVEQVHKIVDTDTTIGELLEWRKSFKHLLDCSNITIAEPHEEAYRGE